MRWPGASLALLALAGCGPFPRDMAGTTDRVAETREFRAVVHRGGLPIDARADALIAALEAETGARVRRVDLTGERPLLALEAGEVDLVVMPFDPKSGWAMRIATGPALGRADNWALTPLTRHGENRWATHVDRAARRATGG